MTSNAEKSDGSAVPLPDDLLRHRVDDERHVVGHDVDDGLRRTEPVLLEIRGVHPHRGCTRRSIEREDQVRHRGAVRIVHVPGREFAVGDVPAVLPDERLEEPLLLRGQPLLGVPPDLVDDLGSVAGRDGGHGNPLRPRHSALLGGVRQGAADRYPRRAHAAGGVAPATARVQLAGNPSASPAARWARWVSWPEKMKLGYVPTRRPDTATLVSCRSGARGGLLTRPPRPSWYPRDASRLRSALEQCPCSGPGGREQPPAHGEVRIVGVAQLRNRPSSARSMPASPAAGL